MNILGIRIGKKKSKKTPKKINPFDVKKVTRIGLVKGFNSIIGKIRRNSYMFNPPEYPLEEIQKALDTEAYVFKGISKHLELVFKNGFEFIGKDPKVVNYIKLRLQQISNATNKPLDIFLRELASSLITYCNAFIFKVRDEKKSGGYTRKTSSGKTLKPVAGYFLQNPTTIEIARDERGKVLKYKQIAPDTYKELKISPDDVIHMYMYKKIGYAFGTPWLTPVLDDIRQLRRLEENIQILLYQHLFPLYHYKVGTREDPAGDTEIEDIEYKVSDMPTEGALVTSERHSIESIGAESKAIRAEAYLEYFENRVLGGIGLSGIDLGRGSTANRSTAGVISDALKDRVKEFQQIIASFFNEYIINELLLENNLKWTQEDDVNRVTLFFPEIDTERKIKTEIHSIFKFEHNAINEDEMRLEIGKDVVYDDKDWRTKTYFELYEKPKLIIQAQDEPFTPEAKGALTGKATEKTGSKETNNKNKPTNQHGQRKGPKLSKDEEVIYKFIEKEVDYLFDDIIKEIDNIIDEDVDFKSIFGIIDNIINYAIDNIYNEMIKDVKIDKLREEEIRKNIELVLEDYREMIKSRLEKSENRVYASLFSIRYILKYKLVFLSEKITKILGGE